MDRTLPVAGSWSFAMRRQGTGRSRGSEDGRRHAAELAVLVGRHCDRYMAMLGQCPLDRHQHAAPVGVDDERARLVMAWAADARGRGRNDAQARVLQLVGEPEHGAGLATRADQRYERAFLNAQCRPEIHAVPNKRGQALVAA